MAAAARLQKRRRALRSGGSPRLSLLVEFPVAVLLLLPALRLDHGLFTVLQGAAARFCRCCTGVRCTWAQENRKERRRGRRGEEEKRRRREGEETEKRRRREGEEKEKVTRRRRRRSRRDELDEIRPAGTAGRWPGRWRASPRLSGRPRSCWHLRAAAAVSGGTEVPWPTAVSESGKRELRQHWRRQ